MTTKMVTCPSGMTGLLRGWKVREVKGLLNAGAGRGAIIALNKVLAAIFEPETYGPYKQPLEWGKVLAGDRAFILINSRMQTFEGDYTTRLQCPNGMCQDDNGRRTRFWWDIDLTELRVQPYPAESLVRFCESNRFDVPFGDRTIQHRLLVGDDEIATDANKRPQLDVVLAQRITSISGIGEDRRKIVAFVEDMEMGDMRRLLKAFDQHDGGVDTEIEAECPNCGGVFDIDLPFGRDFFLPDFKGTKRTTETPSET